MVMKESELPSVTVDKDGIVNRFMEKFRLDLSDTEAEEYFDLLITESATAMFPQVLESLHRFAQYWRE